MFSDQVGGKRAFRDSVEVRKSIHASENLKISYLIRKFKIRAAAGGVVYFIKANGGVKPWELDAIYGVLETYAKGSKFWLVHVREKEDGECPGDVVKVGARRLVAVVERFARYETANQFDLDVWKKILSSVARKTRFPEWVDIRARVNEQLAALVDELNFPGKESDGKCLQRPVELMNSGQWTRLMENDVFRMHGNPRPDVPCFVRWPLVSARRPFYVTTSLNVPIPDSVPLVFSLRILNKQKGAWCEYAFELDAYKGRSKELISEEMPAGDYEIQGVVRSMAPLASGERAVVDVHPLRLFYLD
jgi:hypothetical protein